MKYSKNILNTIVMMVLLVLSVGIVLPVKADTYVDINTNGNIQVIINTNGTVNLIYNGVNIQGEINNLYSVMASITYQMSQLATKVEVENLNQTVYQLINDLDMILNDLYGKTNYLASVIGFNTSDSIVATNLKVGSSTIVEYLDSILSTLGSVTNDITTLYENTSSIYNELQAFENYVDNEFNATYLEIENLDLEIENLGDYTDIQLNNLYIKINEEVRNLQISTLQLINDANYEIRKDVLTDLTLLESKITYEANIQAFTNNQLLDVQQRLYNVENILGVFVLVFIVLAISLVVIVIKRKLSQ